MTQDQVIAGETKTASRPDTPDRNAGASGVPTFAFGQNWHRFLELLSEQRVKTAVDSIRDFTGLPDLKGKSFVDIGCGSGLFSLAAYRLGAERLVSFDVDEFSVACCRHLHEQAGAPASSIVRGGSILDEQLVAELGTFDVVYSWGVLHHTGRMWDAVRNAGGMVNPGGYFYITIYNRRRGLRGSRTWLRIKRLYNRMPPAGRKLMEYVYIANYFQSKLIRFKNPMKRIRDYQEKRGMNWRTDVTDWVGGYPYEFASVQEIFDFVRQTFPDFLLEGLKSTRGLGTNWFLFRRTG
ncbi:MAG: class I SAM-dependent methyltransferase [Planctomycetota bacterium]|jgi:2-polyprenyl-6-hydroxyphenyl methylase/3-demethylubiquinone-9 3-methyltransferase